jgi:hypothetical protein
MNRDQIPFLDGQAKGDASCRHAIGGAPPFPNILAIVYGTGEKLQHIHMHVSMHVYIDRSILSTFAKADPRTGISAGALALL